MGWGEPLLSKSWGGQIETHFESCHIFQCDGIGCTAGGGACDCGIMDDYDAMARAAQAVQG